MNRKILFVIIAVAFLSYVGYSFMDSVTPYVGIAEAESSKSSVQVKGLLAKSAPAPHMDGDDFVFTLEDEADGRPLPRAEARPVRPGTPHRRHREIQRYGVPGGQIINQVSFEVRERKKLTSARSVG